MLHSIIFSLHDKPERVKALRNAVPYFDPKEIAKTFGDVWTNSESLFQNHEHLVFLFYYLQENNVLHLTMDSQERRRFKMIKERPTIVLYRGGSKDNLEGYSWTTSRSVAEFFAHRSVLSGNPVIFKGIFDTRDILGYFRGRNEKEVVIDIVSERVRSALEHVSRETLVPRPRGNKDLFWTIQTQGSGAFGRNNEKLRSLIIFAKMQGSSLSQFTEQSYRAIDLLSGYGDAFQDKINEIRQEIEFIEQEYDLVQVELHK